MTVDEVIRLRALKDAAAAVWACHKPDGLPQIQAGIEIAHDAVLALTDPHRAHPGEAQALTALERATIVRAVRVYAHRLQGEMRAFMEGTAFHKAAHEELLALVAALGKLEIKLLNNLPAKIIARSASDRTDDWPFWYVAETRKSLNITGPIARALGLSWRVGAVLTNRPGAEWLAEKWNAR